MTGDNSESLPPSEEPAVSAQRPETETPAAAKIRIGSQRWAQKNPEVKPKPANPPAPVPRVRTGSQSSESSDSSGDELAIEPDSNDEQKPFKTQRKGKRQEIRQVPEARRYPPPNIRAQLSEDLEQEFVEALGGVSVEQMLSGEQSLAVEPELDPESKHRGRVLKIHRENVFIDLGGQRQGVLSFRAFVEPPELDAVLDVIVSRFNSAEGLYDLILPGGSVRVEDWSQVAEGMVVEARVTGHNKGGLECDVNSLRGFIPASQTSMYRVEDLAQFVGQKFPCVVTEANPDKRNLVLSRRAVLEREKAEAKATLMAEIEVGQVREAVVRSLQEFGAFVDLGGVDGLIHISQLSWDRIRHAKEVLEVGQKVKVKIQKIDSATGKISLAFRDLADNPWAGVQQKYPPRTKASGTVTRIMEFGAFVRLEAGVEGLVHVSELSHKRVWRPSEVVQEGQEVEVLVLSVDPEQQRISLSLKALESRATPEAKDAPGDEAAEPEAPKVVAHRKTPLKGGISGASGGGQFGLKW